MLNAGPRSDADRHAGKSNAGAALGLRLTVNNVVRVLEPAAMASLASLVGLAAICWISAGALPAGSLLSRAHARH